MDVMIKVHFTRKMSFKFECILYLKTELKMETQKNRTTAKAGRTIKRNGLIYNGVITRDDILTYLS